MKVKDLIKSLQERDPEAEVVVYDSEYEHRLVKTLRDEKPVLGRRVDTLPVKMNKQMKDLKEGEIQEIIYQHKWSHWSQYDYSDRILPFRDNFVELKWDPTRSDRVVLCY